MVTFVVLNVEIEVEFRWVCWSNSESVDLGVERDAAQVGCGEAGVAECAPWTMIPSWLSIAVKKASREAAIFAVAQDDAGCRR